MKKILLGLLAVIGLVGCSNGAVAQIKVGDKVPLFSLTDQNGKVFNMADVAGKRRIVIYFYPKDDTPGCTKEACSFRDNKALFAEYNTDIVGISAQDVESKKAFAEKYQLNFSVLADEGNKVRKMFAVPSDLGIIPGRVTYVVDESGVVVFIYNSQTDAEAHVTEALKFVKGL